MNFKKHNKIRKVLLAILPGIIVAGLIFGANVYYDLDLGRVIVNEITRIIGMFETTATTTLATVSGYVGIKTATPTEALTVSGNVLSTGNLTISGGKIFGANQEELWIGFNNDLIQVVRGPTPTTYIVCDSSGNCAVNYNYVGGTGTSNYLAKFSATSTLTTSTITEIGGVVNIPGTTTLATTAGFVGIATSTPYSNEKLTVYGNIWGSGNIILQKGSYNITLTPTTLTANRTLTFPDLSGTVAVSSTAPITLSSTGVIGLTTPLAISYGGTATTSIGSAGSIVYSNGSYYAFTSVGTAGQPLLSGGSDAPTWGTLSVSFGGTGLTSVASGALLYGSGGTTLNTLAIGSAGYILASNGSAPYWSSLSSLSIPTGTGSANYITKWLDTNTLTYSSAIYESGGNVGIGTTTLNAKLTISAAGTQLRLAYSDSYYSDLKVDESGNLILSPTSGKVRVSYGSGYTELAYTGTKGTLITSAGDIEIGVTGSPIYLDEITFISASSSSPILTVTQSGTGYAATFMGGNVGIGTTDVSAKLTVQNLDPNQASLLVKQSGSLFQKTIGGTNYDRSFYIQQTSDGGYVITGYTHSFGAGSNDVFVIKLDSSGNLSWAKTIGGTSEDYSYSIQQTSDGGYVITGYTYSFGAGMSDVFVIKLDSSGNLSWAKTIVNVYGGSIQQTSDGGYVITGYTYSVARSYDVFVIKLDSSGNIPGCSSVNSVSPTVSSPSPTVGSPSPTVSSQNPSTASQCSANFNFTPLVLTPQGNLAIGVTSTQYQLEVAGKIKATQICLGSQCYSSIPEVWWQKSGDNIVYNAGNVGIGTTAPVSLLELYKTDASPILTITSATSTTYSPQIAFRTGATPTTNFTLGVDISTGKLKIVPSSDITTSTGITIDSSGNLGIGTTTPAYKLTINGNLFVSATSTLGSATSTPVIFGGYVQSNIIPFTDNAYTLGAPGFRWANLYAATTTIGDIVFGNEFRITETNATATPQAIIFKNQRGEEIMRLDEYGNLTILGQIIVSSSTQQSTETQSLLGDFVEKVKQALSSLGLLIENGIARIKEIFTEKLTANITITNQLCVGKVCVDEAKFKELLEKNGIKPIILEESTSIPTSTLTSTSTTSTQEANTGQTGANSSTTEATSSQATSTSEQGTTNNQATSNETMSNAQSGSEQSATNSSSTSAVTSTEETSQEISTSTNEQLSSEQQTANNEIASNEQLSNEQSSTITSSTASSQ